jgi:hypothetical protein
MTASSDDLLTSDEALAMFGASGLRIADEVPCPVGSLERVLRGGRAPAGLSRSQRALTAEHRRTVHQIVRAGYAWLLPDQIEGVLSYAEHVHSVNEPQHGLNRLLA